MLITGAGGFVGRSLIDYLVSLPAGNEPLETILVSRKPLEGLSVQIVDKLKLRNIYADLNNSWEFNAVASHVIHLAADGSANAYTQRAANDFVSMCQRLIVWCRALPTPPIVFHASSGACFGYKSFPPISGDSKVHELAHEMDPEWIKSAFVHSRIAAEDLLQKSHDCGEMDLRVGRLYSFIGKHLVDKSQYAVNSFVSMAQQNGNVVVKGNPLTTRSYLSAQDMSHWIYTAVNLDTKPSMLSIGSSIPVTMIELAKFVAENFSVEVRIENSNSVGDRYVADNSSTKKILGVDETIHWRQSLLEFINLSRLSGAGRRSNE